MKRLRTKKPSQISVVLNAYRRLEHFESQLLAVENQSIAPEKIYVWHNSEADSAGALEASSRYTLIRASENFGVWARFAFALNIKTPFVCVFDDDTIPGPRWLENCVESMEKIEGVYGARGVIFDSDKFYFPHSDVGWANPNEEITLVDLIGHCWFLKTEWLHAFWSHPMGSSFSNLAGEDMHLAFTLQKLRGIHCFVPPHPRDNRDLWGNLVANDIGGDSNALSKTDDAYRRMDEYFQYYVQNGWKLIVSASDRRRGEIYIGKGVRRHSRLIKWVKKRPMIFRAAKKIFVFLKRLNINI